MTKKGSMIVRVILAIGSASMRLLRSQLNSCNFARPGAILKRLRWQFQFLLGRKLPSPFLHYAKPRPPVCERIWFELWPGSL